MRLSSSWTEHWTKSPGAPDVVIRNIAAGLVAVKLEISVRSAFVANIELVITEVTAKAERVSPDGLAEGVANAIGGVWLIEIQPVIADRKTR